MYKRDILKNERGLVGTVVVLAGVLGLHAVLLPFTGTAVLGLNLHDAVAGSLFLILHAIISVAFFRPFRTTALLAVLFAVLIGVSLRTADVQLDAETEARSREELRGATVVITGPSDLGSAVAREFLDRGAIVVLLGRSTFSRELITSDSDQLERLYGYKLDLANTRDIPEKARLLREAHPRIDLVICNAGIGAPASDLSEDQLNAEGLEMTAAVNHVGHALLVTELQQALSASPSPRVVFVSSRMHEVGTRELTLEQLADFGLTFPAASLSFPAYSRSKLLNLLWAAGLAAHDAPFTSVSITPGSVATRGMPGTQISLAVSLLGLPPRLAQAVSSLLVRIQLLTWRRPQIAAQIYLYAALAPKELVHGQYIDERMQVRPRSSLLQPQASDVWVERCYQATSQLIHSFRRHSR